MNSKLLQKDVTKILGVNEDCITAWKKNRSISQIQFMPLITQFLGYLPFSLDQTTLSGKLKAYRHVKGFSQKRLGEILKVDAATICSWEVGENLPHKEMLNTLNSMLNKKVSPLM